MVKTFQDHCTLPESFLFSNVAGFTHCDNLRGINHQTYIELYTHFACLPIIGGVSTSLHRPLGTYKLSKSFHCDLSKVATNDFSDHIRTVTECINFTS